MSGDEDQVGARDSVYSVYSISSGSSHSDKDSIKSPISPSAGTPLSPSTPFSASSSKSGRSALSTHSTQSGISAQSTVSSTRSNGSNLSTGTERSASHTDRSNLTSPVSGSAPNTASSGVSNGSASAVSLASSASSRKKKRKGKSGKEVTFGADEIKEMTPVTGGLTSASSTSRRSISSPVSDDEIASPIGSISSILSSPIAGQAGVRTSGQEALRIVSLYVFPVLLTIPLGLLLHLVTLLLTPLYNSTPLRLHIPLLYASYALPSALIFSLVTLRYAAREVISARVCLTIMAIAGDLIIVTGRRVGAVSGTWAGPEWGAVLARFLLGVGAVGGANAFALLCFDHAVPISPAEDTVGRIADTVNLAARTGGYVLHIYYAEKAWAYLLEGSVSFLVQHPEKTILFVSLLLTLLSLFVRSPRSTGSTFAKTTHRVLSSRLKLSQKASEQLEDITGFLPRTISPILLLLRIPLLVLAVRQQIFLRPSAPYLAVDGTLRVLHSEKSNTGQIVVADNLATGYRYLRCDASLLGGRWIMRVSDNGTKVDLGESIFPTFALQEIGVLAARNGEDESLARTISMTTELQLTNEQEDEDEEKPQERALIIGLGVGISAMGLSRRGYALDLVEIDPLVARAAQNYFNLTLLSDSSTLSILPGQEYVEQVWAMDQGMNGTMQKWSYVIHDCFSAGQLPVEVYTEEFWGKLISMVEVDGLIAINVAGVLGSLSSRRILVTLLKVFTQCRGFQELGSEAQSEGLNNMVILCTMAHSPLLSFRPPTRFDVLRSPLRSHMFSTFLQNEIRFDTLVHDDEWDNPDMGISQNGSMDGLDQISTAMATWKAMQTILTREMWLAW